MKNVIESLSGQSKIVKLIEDVKSKKNCSCFGLNFNEISFILKMIDTQKILVVSSSAEAFKYSSQLESLGLRTYVLQNKLENYTYSYFEDAENMKELTLALFKLLTKEIDVLIVLNKVLLQKVINPKTFEENVLKVFENMQYDFEKFKQKLVSMGYKRVDEISEQGEFSVRGDILNVFPINFSYPVRISFFDDLVERISQFSLETYEVLKDEKEIKICPKDLLFLPENSESEIIDSVDNAIKKSDNDEQKQRLLKLKCEIENRTSKKINSSFALPFAKNFDSSIFDYLSNGVVIYLEPKIILNSINDAYIDFLSSTNSLIFEGRLLEEHRECAVKKENLFQTSNTSLAFLNLNTSNKLFESQQVYSFLSSFVKNYNNNFNFLLEDIKNYILQKKAVILCAESNEKALKLEEFLNKNDVRTNLITNFSQIKAKEVYVLVSKILNGVDFVEDSLIVLGNYNIYGTKKIDESG
ncbi:MAG: hypothetical protein ACI4TI_02805, partial [Christensenellales bacterium]